jgi:pimeloyl-ACP methyl ester carboxylesterase
VELQGLNGLSFALTMIAHAGHWMFGQAPREFCSIVLDFLAD